HLERGRRGAGLRHAAADLPDANRGVVKESSGHRQVASGEAWRAPARDHETERVARADDEMIEPGVRRWYWPLEGMQVAADAQDPATARSELAFTAADTDPG